MTTTPVRRAVNRELALAGVIVVAPSEADESPTPEQEAVLRTLHLRKIDLADRVLIVNPGGYVGESTRAEIAYASAAGKPIAFTHPRGHQRSASGVPCDPS